MVLVIDDAGGDLVGSGGGMHDSRRRCGRGGGRGDGLVEVLGEFAGAVGLVFEEEGQVFGAVEAEELAKGAVAHGAVGGIEQRGDEGFVGGGERGGGEAALVSPELLERLGGVEEIGNEERIVARNTAELAGEGGVLMGSVGLKEGDGFVGERFLGGSCAA